MQIDLSPELENFVIQEIKIGHYASAQDIVQKGLLLLKKQAEYIHNIRVATQEADKDFSDGNFITSAQFEEYFSNSVKDL